LAISTDVVTTSLTRTASASDVAKRQAAIAIWDASETPTGELPKSIALGSSFTDTFSSGGQAVFWKSLAGESTLVDISRVESEDGSKVVVTQRKEGTFTGQGRVSLDFVLYQLLGMDLRKTDKAMLQTLRLPPRLISPFLVMVLLSLVTRPGSKEALDRYYVKMKTPVKPDPAEDLRELELSYASPDRFDYRKMFPGTNLEIQKPTAADSLGFLVSVGICVLFVLLATWVASIGS